ncbi:sigma-54-dependent Fis family transcriptional regulator [Bermanella marisrubri]|uniref:Sigma 54-dependent transcriptional activator containing CheY-like receiver domain n=1 Tax=Bermanella marisrubri TaxID=207949 RepID=Q1N2X6_9GAMM|nr:sigma-54 dependent transcriptional regulator [Bermanella marisrubri]EAT12543.1 sigma 54-dependent transcriptional activator containing CheY-like receiver domain [Oceanobacter sp. RED65] [Bermanella marisrubri]QIZ84899.1 sigma-54-dependent Fis family transcriptional regulator [Bermanella marisrubri]
MSGFHILVVEDDSQLREAIVDTLRLQKINVSEAPSGEQAIQFLKRQVVDMVLTDISMGEISGFDLLNHIKAQYPAIPVVLMTAYGQVEKAVQAMQQGATDYLVKPFEVDVLIDVISQFRNQASAPFGLKGPVAEDPSSKALLKLAAQVATSDATVLISGESGTGKEELARYIHQNSERKSGPFVAINCAAIPENMLESTLFGYEKGAFTGAYNSMPGKFEQAEGGTLLLDEISEMDMGLQAKLLRVLQEREVERLGGRKTIKLNVRILATTNRDLLSYVNEKQFREDLYYRLSVFPLRWKALRERPLDILPIAQRLLSKHGKKQGKPNLIFDESAQTALNQYPWPGNVRELDNVIQRALIIQSGACITASDIVFTMDGDQVAIEPNSQVAQTDFQKSVTQMDDIESNALFIKEESDALGDNLKQQEYSLILDALRQEKNKKQAAEKLGISPRTLRYKLAKMREQGIDLPRKHAV